MIKVKIVNKSKLNLPNPSYSTVDSAGVDLMADIEKPHVLAPNHRVLIPTGLFIELPKGFELQIRPRSGLALKKGITVLNSPGTIDADYRGEIGIILINHGGIDVTINPGERIAQGVLTRYERFEFIDVDSLDETDRGTGGFGSTGKA